MSERKRRDDVEENVNDELAVSQMLNVIEELVIIFRLQMCDIERCSKRERERTC